MYYKQNKQSEGAKIILIQKLCATFTCITADAKNKVDEASIIVSGDVLLTIPNLIIKEVLPWLMQFRIARLNFPAQNNLDIAVHPNTDIGKLNMYLIKSLFTFGNYVFSTLKFL